MNTKNTPSLHQQLAWVTQNIIDAICSIKIKPEGLLPHTVFVEETNGKGNPEYGKYQLLDIDPIEKNCIIFDVETSFQEEISLESVNVDWLITIWNRYLELTGETENIERTEIEKALRLILDVALLEIPCFEQSQTFSICVEALGDDGLEKVENGNGFYVNKELSAFLFPMSRFERNASNEDIIRDYEDIDEQYPEVQKLTPDELAAKINDDEIDTSVYFCRFINY